MMPAEMNLPFETERALGRLLSRLEVSLAAEISADPACWQAFQTRLGAHFPRFFRLYLELYVGRYDFFYHLEALLHLLARAAFARPADLRALDAQREADPHWFQSNQMLGGVCYVDLFAQNLAGIRGKIPYFKELGLTYLHLMPLFKMPAGDNDGGYAVSSFREVHPPLGTMRELAALARQLREHDISLCLDLIINHTASEHDWAKKAALGEPDYREMYGIFPDRKEVYLQDPPNPAGPPLRIENLIRAIQGEEELEGTGEDGRIALRVSLAALESVETGKTVELYRL